MIGWESVTNSAFLLFLFLLGSFFLIFFVSKIIFYLAYKMISKMSGFVRYLPVKKLALPLALFLLGIELEVLSSDIQRSFAIEAGTINSLISSLGILATGLLAYHVFEGFMSFMYDRYVKQEKDRFSHRRMATQLGYIDKIVTVIIIVVLLGAILLRFESFEKIGGSLLASAGIASIVIGIAAQESLGNLLAGFQIAFSQPLRIEDTIVVEGEFGVVEEINLSYVVVKTWDQRRLILPIRYFITKPFQNWTRISSRLTGTIIIYLDYSVAVDDLRQAFNEIVERNPKWDGVVKVLQVVDTTEKSIQVRALVSASDSGKLWDLRCEVREELVTYLQTRQPESLPVERNQVLLSERRREIL